MKTKLDTVQERIDIAENMRQTKEGKEQNKTSKRIKGQERR